MKLTLDRAKQIKSVFLDEIEKNRTIPGNMVQPFWDFFSQEFAPGRYSAQPCTCQPKEWVSMVSDVTNAVNEVLNTQDVQVVENLEQAHEEQELAKKKSKKVKETVVATEDKTEQDEETV
jgi:hypothetical protein